MIDKILKEAEENNLNIKEICGLPDKIKGLIINKDILLRKNLSNPEKIVTLTEEIEHYKANVGNIIDIRGTSIKKQELLARWATYEKLLPVDRIISAIISGVSNSYEFAELLELPEEFVVEGVNYYRERYNSIRYKNYLIKFGSQLQLYRLGDTLNIIIIDEFGNILEANENNIITHSSFGVEVFHRAEISKIKLVGFNLIIYNRLDEIEKIINIPAENHKDVMKICSEYSKLLSFESYIAGVTKINDTGQDIQNLVKEYIGEENILEVDKLTLVQDPTNLYDKQAIKVVHDIMGHIGYIPAKHAVKINKLVNENRIIDIMWEKDKENIEIVYFKLFIRHK